MPVAATIDGVSDRGGLFAMGQPHHMLAVPKSIRDHLGKGPGDIVSIVLWKDEEPRQVEVPAAFQALMKKPGVLSFFEGLSPIAGLAAGRKGPPYVRGGP